MKVVDSLPSPASTVSDVATTPAASTSTTPPATTAPVAASTQTLAAYVGIDPTIAPPAPAGEPLRVGVFQPRDFTGDPLEATAEFVNTNLGGVAGRPLELVVCTKSPSSCADEFAADPILVAVFDEQIPSQFAASLAGRRVLVGIPDQSLTPVPPSVNWYPGMIEDLNALVLKTGELIAGDATPKVIAIDPLAATGASIARRELPGVEVVEINSTDGLPAAIQAAGATDADAVVLNAVYTQCPQVEAALASLAITPVVLANVCEPIEGWYQVALGYNLSETDAPSVGNAVSQIFADANLTLPQSGTPYAQDGVILSAAASADLLTIVKVLNGLDGELTPDAVTTALRTFTGTPAESGGQVDCALGTPIDVAGRRLAGSCVRFVDLYRVENGRWVAQAPVDLRSGLTG